LFSRKGLKSAFGQVYKHGKILNDKGYTKKFCLRVKIRDIISKCKKNKAVFVTRTNEKYHFYRMIILDNPEMVM